MTLPNNGVFGMPQLPYGVPTIGSPLANMPTAGTVATHIVNDGLTNGLKRAVSFAADHQGCGYWRMHWPEMVINAQQLGIVNSNNFMILQDNFYHDVTCVRVQRQVTPVQLQFVQYLRNLSNKTNKFKLIYEVDDVIFPEDIPLYNKAREAFCDPKVAATATEIMRLCDVITTPTKYMSDYYTEKSGVKSVVLPNYLPKFWIDRFYNKSRVVENYEQNKRRPRVGYVGSPTHFTVGAPTGTKDDFGDIHNIVRKTLKNFKWVLMGGCPQELADLVRSGEIEYTPWARLLDYPTTYNNLNLNAVIAPLQNNRFNLAKAPIKYLEAGAFGLPCVCQDLEPYKIAPLRFNTGDEMVDILKKILGERRHYLNESDNARKVATKYWLEDHISEYASVYFS